MNRYTFGALSALVVAGAWFSCAPVKRVPEASQAAREAEATRLIEQKKAAEGAEKFARIGELLLIPEGFKLADEMFEKALQADPKNSKANFYIAFTKPVLALQGFSKRFEAVVSVPEASRLRRFRSEIDALGIPSLTRFVSELPAGKKPFETYYDAQRFLREELLPALLSSLEHLGRIDLAARPLGLELNLARLGMGELQSGFQDPKCKKSADGWDCEPGLPIGTHANLDPADLKIMKGSFVAVVSYIRLNTAYSFRGLEEARKKIGDGDSFRFTRPNVAALRDQEKLFTLEQDHQLPQLVSALAETLKGALDLGTAQLDLCRNAIRQKSRSFFKSFCVNISAAASIRQTLALLEGATAVELGKDKKGNPVTIELTLGRFLPDPVKDLKVWLPTEFDPQTGDPNFFPDSSLGGLFKNGDFPEKVRKVGHLELTPRLRRLDPIRLWEQGL